MTERLLGFSLAKAASPTQNGSSSGQPYGVRAKRSKLEFRGAAVRAVVIVEGEHVALGGFDGLLPARADEAAGGRQQERTAALGHVLAVPVDIGTLDAVRAADANVVGRGHPLAALVEADEEGNFPSCSRFEEASIAPP